MSVLNEYENMTASQIDKLKCDKEKELQEAQKNLYEVEHEELLVSKRIIVLQGERKDYQIAMSKARQIVRTLNLDVKILTSEFWRAKDNR